MYWLLLILVFFIPYILKAISALYTIVDDLVFLEKKDFLKKVLGILLIIILFSGFSFCFLKIASFLF